MIENENKSKSNRRLNMINTDRTLLPESGAFLFLFFFPLLVHFLSKIVSQILFEERNENKKIKR